MPNTILPKLIGFGINMLARNGGDPVKTVQNAVTTVRQVADTFTANVRARQAGGPTAGAYPGAPAGEPMASMMTGVNIGSNGQTQDPVGTNDSVPHGVEVVQRFLDRLGYIDMGNRAYGYYGDETRKAVEQFQRDNGLEVTGIVDDATVRAMQNPHPRAGFGMPATEGHFDPNGTATLQQPLFAEAASFYGAQLGLPTSAAMMRPDGAVVQNFERGSLVMKDGRISILNAQGGNMFTPADYTAATERAGNHFINQIAGDHDGDGNQNCGYASANMSLSYLGVAGWSLEGVTPEQGYASTMQLREAGQSGSTDNDYSLPGGILTALTTPEMQAAGVQVSVWDNTWNGSRESDVDRMRLAFMNGDNHTAFVVAGNPDAGWGNEPGMDALYRGGEVFNGGHFVSVVGYNPDTDKFLVMDPMANQPIEVPAADMVQYMEDQNVSKREVLQITYNPPPSTTQQ